MSPSGVCMHAWTCMATQTYKEWQGGREYEIDRQAGRQTDRLTDCRQTDGLTDPGFKTIKQRGNKTAAGRKYTTEDQ